MKNTTNIFNSVKVITLILVLFTVFFTQNILKSNNPISKVEKTTNEEKNKNSNDKIETISFVATISVFAVEFSDFSQFVIHTLSFSCIQKSNDVTNISHFFSKYFRILFSKILPINAP